MKSVVSLSIEPEALAILQRKPNRSVYVNKLIMDSEFSSKAMREREDKIRNEIKELEFKKTTIKREIELKNEELVEIAIKKKQIEQKKEDSKGDKYKCVRCGTEVYLKDVNKDNAPFQCKNCNNEYLLYPAEDYEKMKDKQIYIDSLNLPKDNYSLFGNGGGLTDMFLKGRASLETFNKELRRQGFLSEEKEETEEEEENKEIEKVLWTGKMEHVNISLDDDDE